KGYLQGNEDLGEQLICHRIVAVDEYLDYTVYQTQGDNRSICEIPDQEEPEEFVRPDQIGAVFHTDSYDGIIIKGVGKAYEFINSQLGFFLCILLPMIFFFIYVLIRVVINSVEYKKAKEDEKNEKEKEENGANNTDAPQMSAEEYEQFKQFMAFKNAQTSNDTTSEEKVEPESSDDAQA
ncbi:MAG: hypothetical protein IKB73_00015, partial [Ruminococcus sp.]|nr:hypothetical protein [Ruminococcus sp.]